MRWTGALKNIDDETWAKIVEKSKPNEYLYLWIADGFTPERWPPFRDDDMTVDPLISDRLQSIDG